MYSFAQATKNLTTPKKETSRRPQEAQTPEPLTFTTPPPALDQVEDMTLSDLAHGTVAVTLWSEVLQDKILLVPDGYRRKAGDPVTYTAHEIDVLASMESDEKRRELHKAKKLMGGKVVSPQELEKIKESI